MASDTRVSDRIVSRDERAHTPRTLIRQLTSCLQSSEVLRAAGEDNELERESREVLATLLDITPGDVSRRYESPLSDEIATRAMQVVTRRAAGEPLAYALGSVAFRHLDLMVDARVLIPRPDTEIVVEQALRVTAGRPGGVAVDIGTGSGVIALSLATEGRFDRVIATDLSPDALAVARLNAERVTRRLAAQASNDGHTAPMSPVEFREGADFAPLAGIKASLVVSNPPYIAPEEASELPASVREWEPAMALFADDHGMARYNVLLAAAPSHLAPGGWLVLEVDSRRGAETARRATESGFYTSVQLVRDLSNRDRVLLARLGGDIS